MLGLFLLENRPEKAMLSLTMLNPIDVGRMLIITRMDTAALMGHSGEVFRDFLGSAQGWAVTITVLLAWTALPLWGAVRIFRGKDL